MKNWEDLTPVEKVLELCKRRSVAPSKVEKDLGFGNGYLNPKKVDDIKFKRLEIILNYLGVDWVRLPSSAPYKKSREVLNFPAFCCFSKLFDSESSERRL